MKKLLIPIERTRAPRHFNWELLGVVIACLGVSLPALFFIIKYFIQLF